MKTLHFKNCKVCMDPFSASIAIIVIFTCVQTMTTNGSDHLHFLDCMIISFLILVGSMGCLFVHEYAHVLAARSMGLPVREITVSLFGARTSLDHEPVQPKEALIVSVVGPVANVFAGITLYAGHLAFLQSDIISTVFLFLSVFNGILGAYNLLPVMPLDGGLIVRSILWLVSGNWIWSTRRTLLIGNRFAALCIIAGIVLLFVHHSVMSAVLCILGLSLRQNEKLAYQQIVGARMLTIINPKGFRKEVMSNAIR